MRNISLGSRGADVRFAQRLINIASVNDRDYVSLIEDGVFGRRTDAAVRRYQERTAHVGPNGVVDLTLWRRLGLAHEIDHRVMLVPQHTGFSCWSACVAMIRGVQASFAVRGTNLSTNQGDFGSLVNRPENIRQYAESLGRRAHEVKAPFARDLATSLRRGPVILFGVRAQTGRHAVVISGLWPTQALDDNDTVIRVHNPSPIGRGTEEATMYPDMFLESEGFTPEWIVAA